MKRFLLCTVLGVMIASGVYGCAGNARQNAVDMAVATSALIQLDAAHDQARTALQAMRPALSAEENAVMDHVMSDLDAVRGTARRLIDANHGVPGALADLQEVRLIWSTARSAYLSGRQVVMAHFDALPAAAQRQLRFYDEQARSVDAAVQRMLADPGNADVAKALGDVLTIAAGAAKVAMLL